MKEIKGPVNGCKKITRKGKRVKKGNQSEGACAAKRNEAKEKYYSRKDEAVMAAK